MNTIQDIKIGTKLEIELIDSLGGKIGSTYTSQLLDIKDDESITIAAPIQESRLLLIPAGSTIRCFYIHPELGLLSFLGDVISKERLENVIAINIAVTSKFIKIQRRNHFRLAIMLDVKYREMSEEIPKNNPDEFIEIPEFKKAYTKNVSGCGACIIVGEPIEKGTYIQIVIDLEDGHSVETKCIVVRCLKIHDIDLSKYSIGLSFVGISNKDQDTLIRYIFEKQKQLLKRNIQ